jgi:sulfate adenylyltransferase subunit 2
MKSKHFVLLGHLDHGKSTLIGRLLWDLGKIDKNTKSYLMEIGSKNNRHFAYVLDFKQEERTRGITIDVGHNKLIIDGYSFTFSDAPGHQVFRNKIDSAIKESNAAIICLAADDKITDELKKSILYAHKNKITDFIVCITKMDLVKYKNVIFEKLSSQILPLLKKSSSLQFIPTSALKGDNITKSSKKMPWYQGVTLIESFKNANTKENSVNDLVRQSKEIFKKAEKTFRHPVMLWAGGKDSTAMLAIAKELYPKKLPFPLLFIDTTYKFSETYDFINLLQKKWKLNLLRITNKEALEKGVNPWSVNHFTYCHELKTKPLKKTINDEGYDGAYVAIRWDEHGIRGKEQYFSKRTDPPHYRIHPMLHWSESEIWQYIKSEKIPYNSLYDKEEHNGLVYRSIGCWPFTKPIPKEGADERSGREVDKERLMESLRSLGYM